MGLIDISNFMIINQADLDVFLTGIGSNMIPSDSMYPITLLLANLMTYSIVILFVNCIISVIKYTNRRIRRIFS